ncbi:MAG: peptidoglycan-binding domain-containing protein [Candidatus Omnitrophota bacterium]
MKRLIVVVLAVIFSINLAGCGRKNSSSKEIAPEAMSIEELSMMGTESKDKTDTAVNNLSQAEMPVAKDIGIPEVKLAALPPSGPYRPSIRNIQTALKNAGCYTGKVDGKSGPLTKKAIKDFQKTANLKIDGKVGPKTWDVLSKYLNSEKK